MDRVHHKGRKSKRTRHEPAAAGQVFSIEAAPERHRLGVEISAQSPFANNFNSSTPPPPPPPGVSSTPTLQTPTLKAPANTPASGIMPRTAPVKGFLADIASSQFVLKKQVNPDSLGKKKLEPVSDVAAILMRRAALEASDSDDDDAEQEAWD